MGEIYPLPLRGAELAPQRTFTMDEDEFRRDHDPAWTESIPIRKQNLNVFDVASLILNKMVGTGIFTTPGSIVLLNKSKALTVGLWVLGGPYCLLCLLVYLDYGTGFPFNGGELIYLNAVWPGPNLLQAFLFAGFFIALGHTAGNSVAFSRHVLLAAQETSDPDKLKFDSRLMKIIAIVILGIVCLLLWITPKTGLFLNKLLALYKVVLLLVLGIAGIAARQNRGSGAHDWSSPEVGVNTISGLIFIIYSYTGWENANYIIGDIHTKRRDLRNGAFGAVALVTMLYTLMSLGFFEACSVDALKGIIPSSPVVSGRDAASPTTTITSASPSTAPPPPDLGIAWVFSQQVFGHRRGIELCIALSAFGNLIAVAYTSSKVKQAIALHHFLPFSGFFAKDDHFMTPGGALLLHWICSSIVIIAMPNSTEGYGFIVSLFTYGQLLVGIAIGLGLPRLKRAVERSKLDAVEWKPFFNHQVLTWIFGPLLACINLVVMIGAAATTAPGEKISRWLLPVVVFSVLAFALVYWWCFRRLEGRLGRWLGWETTLEEVEGLDDLGQMRRDERRDGTEQYFKHKLEREGRADRLRYRVKGAAKWAEDNL